MVAVRMQDETVICTRCGVTFLWSVEEQKLAADEGRRESAPDRCPGCRQLAPAAGRERGLVKWFSARRNYGFILRAGAADLFAHRSQLYGTGRLQEGDLVEFGIEEDEKGPAAVDIRLLAEPEG